MAPELEEFARLAPLGFVIGAYGTLVGAGGGSLLVPALLLLMPREQPAAITSVSMVNPPSFASMVASSRSGFWTAPAMVRSTVMLLLRKLPCDPAASRSAPARARWQASSLSSRCG